MKLQFHSLHFDVDQKLVDFIQKKVDKLETFYDRVIDGEVILKVEKDGARDNKIVEIKLNIPGAQVFSKEQAKSFEAGVDEAVEGLRRQLKKRKEKTLAH
ncbi:MAG: ribosome-associated translation inhibitor RaiA [Reichenbachiella sp.]|uniref:ribosome hibernation-promoting factor, HPF/YfiA family n=1 Tax=Reichenbachiella sp. TaxID=2184521 RepID=UPI003267D44A